MDGAALRIRREIEQSNRQAWVTARLIVGPLGGGDIGSFEQLFRRSAAAQSPAEIQAAWIAAAVAAGAEMTPEIARLLDQTQEEHENGGSGADRQSEGEPGA